MKQVFAASRIAWRVAVEFRQRGALSEHRLLG
jgi:hypothetical protein